VLLETKRRALSSLPRTSCRVWTDRFVWNEIFCRQGFELFIYFLDVFLNMFGDFKVI
jgi:hypothetical protein